MSNIEKSDNHPKVGVVIPAYNEEEFIGLTLKHLLNQDLKPSRIIVINDGSTDKTKEIVSAFSNIEIIDRQNKTSTITRKQLAETYNAGLKKFSNDDCEFIMILDADVLLPKNYLSLIIKRMKTDHNLAITSGIIEGEYSSEPRGAGRVVRTDFWKKIGLRYPVNYGFEGYLLLKAESLGLKVSIFTDLIMKTQRKTGATYNPTNYRYYGYGLKALGYYFPYAIARILLFSRRKPKGAFYMLKGFLEKYDDLYEPELREYVRKTQRHNILHFKLSYLKRTINLLGH